MAQHEFISRFSPNRTDPAILDQIFVQRRDLLDQSLAVLRDSALTANKHHLLFVGPRGCGKTHLLALIVHRLGQQTDLADRLRIAWLNEDETSISFLDLLIRIYRALSDRYPQEFPLDDLKQIYGHDREQARDLLSQHLITRIGNRTVLILVENLDALFTHLDVSDQRTWRAFVQNHPVFATVATSQSLFAGVSDREQPFFGFFDTRHLRSLTVEEATGLLQRIARLNGDSKLTEFLATPRGRARVQAIHHLSGGNHRLYIVLSDFISQEALDELVRPFEEMVDEQLTPYYQERLRWLSPLQRKIVEFLCFRVSPVAVKVIADRLFAEHGTITSQLKKLREMGYVASNPRGRESLYELAEPLMRLSMQVKDTHDHQPLELIVDFLRVWYEREDLEQRLARIAPAAPGREYLTAALAKLQSGEPDLRRQLLCNALEDVDLEHCDAVQIADLRALAEDTGQTSDWLNYAKACVCCKRWLEAVVGFDKIACFPGAPVAQVAFAISCRGFAFSEAGRVQEAIADYTRAIEMPDAPAAPVAWALVNRGIAHGQGGRLQDAVADYTSVIELQNVPAEHLVQALVMRAMAFDQAGQAEEAIADYTRVIKGPGAPAEKVAWALTNRGAILDRVGRAEEALVNYTQAINLPGVPTEQLAQTLIIRGIAHDEVGQTEEAVADYTRAIEMSSVSATPVAYARVNRGVAHGRAGRIEEAIADFTQTVELPGAPVGQVARALVNRGGTRGQAGQAAEAIADFTRAIELPSAPAEQVAHALVGRGLTLDQTNRDKEAIADWTRVAALPGAPADLVALARGCLATASFNADQWGDGIEQLRNLLGEGTAVSGPTPVFSDAAITAIFRQIGSPETWQARLAEAVTIYAQHNTLPHLGDALVRHLAQLASSPLSSAGLDQWLAAWESASSQHPEMRLPLRLLGTGIAYLKTQPRDETVLLQLPKEERTLVRQALGLPEEQPE